MSLNLASVSRIVGVSPSIGQILSSAAGQTRMPSPSNPAPAAALTCSGGEASRIVKGDNDNVPGPIGEAASWPIPAATLIS